MRHHEICHAVPVPLRREDIQSCRRTRHREQACRRSAPIMWAACCGRPRCCAARADHAAGRIATDALRRIEDEAVRQVVRMQEDIGLQGVTDGEFRRVDWLMDFKFGIGGVEQLAAEAVHVPFKSETGGVDWTFVPYKVGRLHHKGTVFGADFSFLKSVAKATPKLTMPSPSMMHYPGGRGIDRAVYPDIEQFFADLAGVYIKQIAALGRSRLQLSADGRYEPGDAQRSGAPRRDRRGRRHRSPALHRAVQHGAGGQAARHDDLHASVPRQFPLGLARRRGLRARRRGDVQRAQCRRLLPRIRRRAFGRFRAAAVRAEGPQGRARPGHHQEARAGVEGRFEASH